MESETTPLLDQRIEVVKNFGVRPEYLTNMLDPKDPQSLKKLGGIEGLCQKLLVDPTFGLRNDELLTGNSQVGELSSAEISGAGKFAIRRKYFGRNELPESISATFFELVKEAFNDKTMILLSVAALISLLVGIYEDYYGGHKDDPVKVGWVEGVAIMAAVAVVCFTNAINDYNKEKQFRKLNAKKEDRNVKVLRDGREEEVGVHDLVVGDVLLIEPGDIMAVDGVYLSGHEVVCDESSATGESDAIKKGTLDEEGRDPFVLSGAKVLSGVGRVVVVAVGKNSFYGKIMMAMRGGGSGATAETPLQKKLDTLSEEIAKYGISAAGLLFMSLLLKYLMQSALLDEFPPAEEVFSHIVNIAIECITVVVVAVPEGLPMAVTIALAYATTQMIKDGNLVRQLAACETMGGATAVCTDKTGTLTQNRMTVVRASAAEMEMESSDEAVAFMTKLPEKVSELINEGSAVNSAAFEGTNEHGRIEFIGSKSECALLEFIKRCGADYRNLRAAHEPLFVWPFSSEKKYMATVVAGAYESEVRLHVKGASEIVLANCTHVLDGNGQTIAMTQAMRVELERNIYRYARKALRTFALAFRTMPHDTAFDPENAPIAQLTWISLMGIMDPLRPSVIDSVADCHRAGVFVRMITGDNIETAEAIAKNAGILTKGGRSITGPEWRALSPEAQHQLLPRLQVMARSSPLDKQILVARLQERDEVVAMTGDGTNDAPALKMADVGFSMGIAGTEVAKEASDIILMDDNFSSIVQALKWGRAVNVSVRKFLQFQLTVNITAVLLTFISSLVSSSGESVLTAVQLLWVNMIMDTLAALALATEGPTAHLLERLPIPKNASLITFEMWRMITIEAAFQVAVNLVLLNKGHALFKLPHTPEGNRVLGTIIFNTFVFLQVFNELNCRRIAPSQFNLLENILHDHGFLYVQLCIVVLQYLIVTYGGLAFSTTPLTGSQWIATILIGSLSVPVGLLVRTLPDFGVCFGLQRTESAEQQHRPTITRSEMNRTQAAKDVKNVLKFFSRVRSSMKASKEASATAVTYPSQEAVGSSERNQLLPNTTATSSANDTSSVTQSPLLYSATTSAATASLVGKLATKYRENDSQ
ncbi:Calcium-transporting ATPase PAT1 [Zancudomyces culisetae]|uniref:Calcium-transporting ATPase n=1 Tax=Zancudomyces culisetae TaxID=1213189 RepID=A0A1R1PSB2_ZANCU|nr:Calcium-transporting ATPase PAT1 [Zancudomyces culisetae]|eukprot:OMH83848.1 Calcium-transporting ATPase PAT1 [Zancudomyces culisetae]